MFKETSENKYRFILLFLALLCLFFSLLNYANFIYNLIAILCFLLFTTVGLFAPNQNTQEGPLSQKIRRATLWFCTNSHVKLVFSGLFLPMLFLYQFGNTIDNFLLQILQCYDINSNYVAVLLSFVISIGFELLAKFILRRNTKN